MLWNRSLVMLDTQTKGLWSHLLGRCMQGPLQGEELEAIPSLMLDWKTWRERYPETTAMELSDTAHQFRRGVLDQRGVFVIGARIGGHVRAWEFDDLRAHEVLQEIVNGVPILVTYDDASRAAGIFDRRLDGVVWDFERVGNSVLIDRETQMHWDPVTGRGTAESGEVKRLSRITGIVSYLQAWHAFHPDSSYWQPQ